MPAFQLSTQQLEYLVAIDQAATWAEAAARLGVTPSALSQGLAELERRIGLSLFEPQGRGRVLTANGRQVLDYAKRIVATTADLGSWAESVRQGERGHIRLGLIDVAAVHHFAQPLRRFHVGRPDVELLLTVAPSGQLLEALLAGRLDAAIMVEPPTGPGTKADVDDRLTVETVMVEDLAVYAPPATADAVASGPPTEWGPWVGFPAESHTRQLIARALRDAGAEYRVRAVSNQPDVLRQLVMLGMGWTVLPVSQAEAEPAPLRRARSEPLLSRRLVLARRPASVPDAATDSLLAMIRQSTPESGSGESAEP